MAPATQTPPRERLSRGSGTDHDAVWHVIVLNDDHNTFDGVALALSRVLPNTTFERGLRLADTIHTRGRAIVWSGPHETAEHYHDQLLGWGLTMAPLERG